MTLLKSSQTKTNKIAMFSLMEVIMSIIFMMQGDVDDAHDDGDGDGYCKT